MRYGISRSGAFPQTVTLNTTGYCSTEPWRGKSNTI
nr:MAG TPA: hypothetical protein [Caudoviricetes sp.]